ncbi:hypothetical protein rosag_43040 [Roseisolibacter agri]|uniref:Uncharacterized protein n=2 Tax=Roseisolibacter agri TaxID=2014610 RepID=A0AA37V8H7_9BACT|nr:hypothetical protein rosag_43040 [Roseisolibacter agri]
MFGSKILDVAVGLILVFFLVSVICSTIREGLEAWLKSRAAFLEQGIRELLHDEQAVGLARSVYTHPLIYSLYAGRYTPGASRHRPFALARGTGLPSYIPSRNFALALMDLAARGPVTQQGSGASSASPVLSLAEVRANVVNLENAYVQRVLLTAIDTAQGDLDRAVANLAAWFDSGMDRVSGAYKRGTQNVVLVIALIVTVGLNINTITIADYLYRNDEARAALVARAEAAARDSSLLKGGDSTRYLRARAALDSLQLPIGWDIGWGAPRPTPRATARAVWADIMSPDQWWNDLFAPIVGLLITAFAASLGAPFWFDVLNKVMVIRSTVKPREKSPEEGSEDRQSAADRERIAAQRVGAQAPPVGAGVATPAAPPAPVAEQPAPVAEQPPAPEEELDFDGCNVLTRDRRTDEAHTADEELPESTGGVA